MRGRAISILHTVAFVGVTIAGPPLRRRRPFELWLARMYLIGIIPLLLVAWMRRRMRETARFEAAEKMRVTQGMPRPSIFAPIRQCMGNGGVYRSRLLLVAGMCNCIGLVGGPTISFFSLYAQRDHGWTSHEAAPLLCSLT